MYDYVLPMSILRNILSDCGLIHSFFNKHWMLTLLSIKALNTMYGASQKALHHVWGVIIYNTYDRHHNEAISQELRKWGKAHLGPLPSPVPPSPGVTDEAMS